MARVQSGQSSASPTLPCRFFVGPVAKDHGQGTLARTRAKENRRKLWWKSFALGKSPVHRYMAHMQVVLLRAKLHRARVTESRLDYEGSILLPEDWCQRVGILPYEKVLVSNATNATRFETYVLYGPKGSGQVILNGPAARLGQPGDELTIMSFGLFEPAEALSHQPRILVFGEQNELIKAIGEESR
ncbi:aspartate 1-decarboxylase [Candidatus Methylacidithermus pantelleriae]|uniref:Aspartate 1-decarboxylase n=1 Tax=Candidatus Methylacidithermus pantelleriae TaxID=2744239 RepID=A0A8J2BI68_9BACT|nr:aspartate 1-decarboxylase [Candidatus Methylacidithermus pantelleriae]CAF0696992.1 Aspartate 1-decarboxylase alpha chain,Aspartate 1-decarboxylase beta chain,Aspartate 1-decarboxylase (modular protein) [Candidatus Methylacidithermus pantelleriae]